MAVLYSLIIVMLLSFFLTGLVRYFALSWNLLDRPNYRSSHSVPTPRGGGIAIVIGFYAGLALIGDGISLSLLIALLGSGLVIALVGLLDDHSHIGVRWRLLAHFFCSAWVLYWIGIPALELMGHHFEHGLIGGIVGMLYLVWVLNLYNFMDGIDGLASVEAVMVGVGATLVYVVSGVFILNVSLEFFLPLFLAAASFGFLIWNFPKAKIFMGDVGSGFLGLMIGALSLYGAVQQPSFLWSWLVLLGVFIVDATLTLLRRFIRSERVYDAHRTHAYQHAANTLMGHQRVTYAVMGINFLWLFPIAIAIAVGWVSGLEGLVLAYVPLILLAFRFRAGKPQ